MCVNDVVRTASGGVIRNQNFNLRLSQFQLQHNK